MRCSASFDFCICARTAIAPTLRAPMLLTRIWGVILAALASLCLGGMFLLSSGNNGDFSEADRTALRALTEAGIAALEAEIESSPVRQVGSILVDTGVREALLRTAEQEEKLPEDKIPMAQLFRDAAQLLRDRTSSDGMTLALIDASGAVVAMNGLGEPLVSELVGSSPYQDAPIADDALFSIMLGGQIHVVQMMRTDVNGRRLVAFEPLQVGAESLLRRVFGTETPAGIVRGEKLIGEVIGDQAVSGEMVRLAKEHPDDAPDQGASKVLTLGEGLDARIGALGRVPGPAGKGKNGALLVVVSRRTAAAGHRDLTDALADAREKGLVSTANWVLLALLLVLCAALALYLPAVEALGPMRRLSNEFIAVSRGAQHQIFHDRYGGPTGELARAANAAHEALRAAYLAELEIDEEVADESSTGSTRQRPKTMRGRKLTRSVRKVGDELPEAPAPAPASAPDSDGLDGATAPRRSTEPPAAAPSPAIAPPTSTVPAPAAPRVPLPRAPAPPATRTAVAPPAAAPPAAAAPPRRPTPIAPPPSRADIPPSVMTPPDANNEDPERMRYYREIFDEFLQVKIACGENTDGFTFDKFVKKLQKNTQDILDKHSDVRDVQFTVYVKDGKAALKAKVIRGTGGGL
jgi:hypothetical protein